MREPVGRLFRSFGRPVSAIALAGALIGVAACRDTGGEGELFTIDGKVFVFNYRVATATYLVNLTPLRPVEDGQIAVASFEDPAGGGDIVVRKKIWPKLPKTTIESPPLRCVVKDRPYKVSIRIEGADGTRAADDRNDHDLVGGPDPAAGQAACRRPGLHAQSGTRRPSGWKAA